MRTPAFTIALAAILLQTSPTASIAAGEFTRTYVVAGSETTFENAVLAAGLSLGSATSSFTFPLDQDIPLSFASLPQGSTRFLVGRSDSVRVSGNLRFGIDFSYPDPANAPKGPLAASTSGSVSFTSGSPGGRVLTLSAQTTAGTCPPSCDLSFNQVLPVTGVISVGGSGTPGGLRLTGATAASVGNDTGYSANVSFTGGRASTMSTFTYQLPAYSVAGVAFTRMNPEIAAETTRRLVKDEDRFYSLEPGAVQSAFAEHRNTLWLDTARAPQFSEPTSLLPSGAASFAQGVSRLVDPNSTSKDYWSSLVGLSAKGLESMLLRQRGGGDTLDAHRQLAPMSLPDAADGNIVGQKATDAIEAMLNATSFIATARSNMGHYLASLVGANWDPLSGIDPLDDGLRGTVMSQYEQASAYMTQAAVSLREFAELIGEDGPARGYTRLTFDESVAAYFLLISVADRDPPPPLVQAAVNGSGIGLPRFFNAGNIPDPFLADHLQRSILSFADRLDENAILALQGPKFALVPEPTTWLWVGAGLVALVASRKRFTARADAS